MITYSGKVRFSDETLFKWSYKEPTKKEVCSDGLELLVVDHDLEQVSAYRISNGINIAQILKKAVLHSKNIYVAEYENKKYTIQVDRLQQIQSNAYFDDPDNKEKIHFKHMKY